MIPPPQPTVTAPCGCVVGRQNLAILTECPRAAELATIIQCSGQANDGIHMGVGAAFSEYRDHSLTARETVRKTEMQERIQRACQPHLEDLRHGVNGVATHAYALAVFQRDFDGDVNAAIATLHRFVSHVTSALQ